MIGRVKGIENHILSQTLLEHDNVDPNVKGEKGSTALHYCAAKDRHKCAKLLVSFLDFVDNIFK